MAAYTFFRPHDEARISSARRRNRPFRINFSSFDQVWRDAQLFSPSLLMLQMPIKETWPSQKNSFISSTLSLTIWTETTYLTHKLPPSYLHNHEGHLHCPLRSCCHRSQCLWQYPLRGSYCPSGCSMYQGMHGTTLPPLWLPRQSIHGKQITAIHGDRRLTSIPVHLRKGQD